MDCPGGRHEQEEKLKIRYIIFVLIIIGIVVFVGKITKLDDLNAEKSHRDHTRIPTL